MASRDDGYPVISFESGMALQLTPYTAINGSTVLELGSLVPTQQGEQKK